MSKFVALRKSNSISLDVGDPLSNSLEPRKKGIPPVFRNQAGSKKRRYLHGSMQEARETVKGVLSRVYGLSLNWQATEEGYLYIQRSNEPDLFEWLDATGIFEFHETNESCRLIYQHQVAKFLKGRGWKLYINGYYAHKGVVEIHHLDANKRNNDPNNLRYVSPQLNLLCSRAIYQPYYGEKALVLSRPMPETPEEAHYMVCLTCRRVLKSRSVPNVDKEKIEQFLALPQATKQEILKAWSSSSAM